MRASLIVLHTLLTLPFSGLISLVSADDPLKMWIDPSCKTEQVQALNEARWLSGQMSEQLSNQDLDVFKNPLGWFFNIGPPDRQIIDYIRSTYARIGKVQRVLDRKDAKLRVYCDNQKGFVPEDGSQAAPDGSDKFKATAFKWEQEELVAMGDQLHCRTTRALGSTANRGEFFWKRRGLQPSGKLPSDRVVMFICDKGIESTRFSWTTKQATNNFADLGVVKHASFAMIGSWTALHEFAHVDALSNQDYSDDFTDMKLDNGVDYFRSTLADPYSPLLSGYFEPGKIPGHVLQQPFRTVVNPDSYAPFALTWQMRRKQYEMIQQNPYVEDLKWKKNTNLPLGPDPNWSQPNSGINWSDEATPGGHA